MTYTVADLEMSLHRRDRTTYVVEARFSRPDSMTEQRLLPDKQAVAQFDFNQLRV